MVRKVIFEDGETWIARVRMPDLRNGFSYNDVKQALSSELACMKLFRYAVRFFLVFDRCKTDQSALSLQIHPGDLMLSDVAAIVKGLQAFGQHQDFVNKK